MFRIDVMSRQPVYEQIISQVEQFVLIGILVPGSQIPSVRSLSVELSINPNTIQKAYSELDRRGLIYSVPGRGCFITENAMDILSSLKRKQIGDLEKLMYELVLAGVTREEIIKCMDNAFMLKGDKKND